MTEFEKLQAIIADVLNVSPETITPDTTFVDDLGADSLDIFQIIMGIEEDFDIEIDNEEAEKIACEEKVDLGGRLLLPGFVDTHLHMLHYAFVERSVVAYHLQRLFVLVEDLRFEQDARHGRVEILRYDFRRVGVLGAVG